MLVVLGLLVRVLAGVVLAGTGGSVLAVAVVHALFNASTAEGTWSTGSCPAGTGCRRRCWPRSWSPLRRPPPSGPGVVERGDG